MPPPPPSPSPITPASTDAILESISDGVFTVDAAWRITSFNRAAERITGIRRQDAIGKPCAEVFRASLCEANCALRHTLATGRPVVGKNCFIVNAHGDAIPISVSTAVLRDATGHVIGGAETFRDLSEVEALRRELTGRGQPGGLVSRSPAMRQVLEMLPALATSPTTVLIQGETGTGKELLARAIHEMGPRASHPFVAVNCGALPDTLLESELFGYKKGAFTGAGQDKPGRFVQAGEGTLFLDEIGEVSPALQVRLLRVLQTRIVEPLGATRGVPLRARILAATNRDLAELVRKGHFRQDLFYRIHVLRLNLPPLRQRPEDLPALVAHFVARFNHLQQRGIQGVTPESMALLLAHDWPGNVRELENVVERAFILCSGPWIEPRHLPEELRHAAAPPPAAAAAAAPKLGTARRAAEEQAIRAALAATHGNRQAAAASLGLHKTTLFRRMKALGIQPPAEDGRTRRRQPE
ncbi:MAG: sigma 54-interacting transcriptional regulator [Lentisphaeria bacterium]|jgi:PAS domain S-box-containing protein